MRQLYRLFFKPFTFFSQLQWSSYHVALLFLMASVAFLEIRLGRPSLWVQQAIYLFQSNLHLNLELARWAVAMGGAILGFGAAYGVTTVLWFLGQTLGRSSSHRVLFRRLAVVYSLLTFGVLLLKVGFVQEGFRQLGIGVLIWGVFLAAVALQVHFHLRAFQSGILVALAALVVVVAGMGIQKMVPHLLPIQAFSPSEPRGKALVYARKGRFGKNKAHRNTKRRHR